MESIGCKGNELNMPNFFREPRPGSFAGRSVHHAGAKAQVASAGEMVMIFAF